MSVAILLFFWLMGETNPRRLSTILDAVLPKVSVEPEKENRS
jgi:hypothetical protein